MDLPRREGTVILAFDVSSSMKAKDLKPTRMAAAKQAARAFVADQPSSIRIGVVAFSDAGYVVQAPTRSHDEVLAAIGRLSPRGGTALGAGSSRRWVRWRASRSPSTGPRWRTAPGNPGSTSSGSAAVVLLSDGDNTAALDPLALAPVAAQAGVRIFPIGIGSPNGAVVDIDGFQVATALDADLLRGVAKRSGGTYFSAGDATALRKVYEQHRPPAHHRRPQDRDHRTLRRRRAPAVPRRRRALDALVRAGDLTVRFLWPFALIGLVLPLIVIAAYFWTRRRRRKYAVTFASLSLIKQAQPERSRWRRLVPAALLLAAIAALVLATARPQALLATSRSDTSIILTIDVSRSMCSTDVSPNRLAAAEAAARKFVDDQPGGTRMGLVAFAGSAQILVPPTSDRDKLHEAIDGLTTSIGTAIGNGVLTSIDALSRVNPDIAPSTVKAHARATPAGPLREQVRTRRRRAAHRRCGHHRGRSARRRPAGVRSPRPGVHHRVRHHHAEPAGVHGRAVRW